MKHSMKNCYSTGGCFKSDHPTKHSNMLPTSHLGRSSLSHHGGFHKPIGGTSSFSHKSHNGGSHLSSQGGSRLSSHGASRMPHLGGSQLPVHGSSHLSHSGVSLMSLHPSSNKAYYGTQSMQGTSGCKGVSFSKQASIGHGGANICGSHFSSPGSYCGKKIGGLLNINEKETMQILNERLSTYMDKVTSLEQENTQLERKISEWYTNNAPSSIPDTSQYFRIISDLQKQIAGTIMDNTRIILQIDNARLAADDFKNKSEMELQLNKATEADAKCLSRVLEGLNRERCELEMDVQDLEEELQQMKRNHEEEVNCLRTQLGARVNVELNAAPSIDLNKALSEIRNQYENLMETNLREAENMFIQRSEDLNCKIGSGAEQLQSVQTEIIELKRTLQTLEIELQSQLSMTSALESSLAETQATYGSQTAQLQCMINNVESKLVQIRSDLERQNYDYKTLMDQKTHLEMEIATYKCLLEGHEINVSGQQSAGGKCGSRHTVVHQANECENKC